MLTNNYRSLEDLRFVAEKCPRCSQCKFPPLTRVESQRFSLVCPSYEEFKFHASAGGGMLVMGMSLADGRSQLNENVRRFIYGCTACGACDVSCKFSSDIEVLEIIYMLRAKCFEEMGPAPEHKRILDSIETKGQPLPDAKGGMGDWMADCGVRREGNGGATTLLFVGPHYALQKERRQTLANAIRLLRLGGVSFTVLGADEPYTGRAAMEIGDWKLFEKCARRTAKAVNESPASQVLCLSAEDYSTLRAHVPKFTPVEKPIRHVAQVYDELLKQKRLRPARPAARGIAAWHDPCYLGRLSEPYTPWRGEKKKVFGQLIVYDPPRPVNRGTNGCYEPPRRVLKAIPGLTIREFYRQREYAYNSGEGGQAAAVAPEFVEATARRRVEEAKDIGIERIVTECPQSIASLEKVAGANGASGIAVTSLTDLLAKSVEGGAP